MKRHLASTLRSQSLRVLDAVATQRSLLKAAAVLGVSQPALTRTVHELERQAGAKLFHRDTRGVRPTEAGRVMIDSARRILAELRRTEEDLDRLNHPDSGHIRLGALPSAATGILPGVLASLRAAHPNLRVALRQGRSEDLLPLLAAGELDLIVGRLYRPILPDGMHRDTLWNEPLAVIARTSHPLFSLSAITAAEILRHGMALPTISQRVGQEIDHVLAALGVDPTDYVLRSSSNGLIRELLHNSDLISIMPSLMMVGDQRRGTLRVLDYPVGAPDRPSGIIRIAGPPIPALVLVTAALRAHIAELAALNLLTITKADTNAVSMNADGHGAPP